MNKHTTRNLIAFFILTFVISWLLWLPRVLTSNDIVQLPEYVGILGMIAPFGPFIAAFLLTGLHQGWSGIKKLGKRGWSLDFDKKWLLPTIFLMPLAALLTVGVMLLLEIPIEWEHGVSLGALLPTFVFIFVLTAIPEEYGWRGYALGRMLTRRSALAASLILGLIWGLWHLPLHFIEGTTQASIAIYEFILQQMVLAVFYTWLFNNTRGAVFVAILFHTFGNLTGAAVPFWTTELGRWIGFGVLVIFAVVILVFWGPKHLSRSSENRYSYTVDET